MPAENVPAIAIILTRLAQACEVHLHDASLARSLRALAAQEEPIRPNKKSSTLAQATALAGALSKYVTSDDSTPDALYDVAHCNCRP